MEASLIAPLPRPPNYHTVSFGLLVMLPTLMFFLVSFFFVFLSHTLQSVVWTLVAVCLLISLVFMNVKKAGPRDGPNFWLNLGLLCFVATVAAATSGVCNWRQHTWWYWAYAGQRKYENVSPSEPALSHMDAGMIVFSSSARVDTVHAVAYRGDREQLFCVAPVVGASQRGVINYWAAGVDCCPRAGNFSCGEVGVPGAHSGLVRLQGLGGSSNGLANFQRAAEQAVAEHGLTASPDALFLRWVEDPEQAQRVYWNDGVRFLLCSIGMHAAFSVAAGLVLHCCRRLPGKSKLEDRRLSA